MLDRADMPDRIKRLPVDSRGYPVPKFVRWVDGVADFRLADTRWLHTALAARRCFLCGETLGRYMAFVIGPMCAINRVTAEPPTHLDCAQYACRACPFLTYPQRGRNTAGLPADLKHPGGFMATRNPGVALVWVCTTFRVQRATVGNEGLLIHLGEATAKYWYCRGRPATLPEVLESIESGLPFLRDIARKHDGPEGERDLEALITATLKSIREEPQWQCAC